MKRIAVSLAVVLWVCAVRAQDSRITVLEAEDCKDKDAETFLDTRCSGGKCAGLLLRTGKNLVSTQVNLQPGDYVAMFWLEAVPAPVIHHLAVTLSAGDSEVTLGQIHFDSRRGYQPLELAFSHSGGRCGVKISAVGGSGFDGMRKSLSEEEKAELGAAPSEADALGAKETVTEEDAVGLLEGERNVNDISRFDHAVFCDRIEIRPVRLASVMVTGVEVDKVHYKPDETVRASADFRPAGGSGEFDWEAEEITETDSRRKVSSGKVKIVEKPVSVSFEYRLDGREFGHELKVSLKQGGREIHSRSCLFGVSRNVYRVGITGNGGPQDMRQFTAEKAAAIMQENKRRYANYFERFAWAPCDYSDLTPDTEIFYSGQTQYPGSISGFRNLLSEAHKAGVKGITYGKACAGGIAGFMTFQRHPEFFQIRPEGLPSEAMSVFYLERMLANDYNLHAPPSEGGWQHWASLWCDWSHDDTVIFGAHAIMDSIEMFGWDGVRWDGHFVGRQKPFLDLLKSKYPDFVHGYNIAFANPGSKLFLPPDTNDFHVVAADHGMLMDESVRDWSHSNFSPGYVRPFYEAICREADYEKRIGGLPLFITFDMASPQDRTLNVLFGLAAGQRYTYITSPGDFPFGPLTKFLTRYSAFVWDDTRRIANPESVIEVACQGAVSDAPWWNESVWLRSLQDRRQQLLVNLVNPPLYSNFAARVQTTAATLSNVTVSVRIPQGAVMERAFYLSPDIVEGHVVVSPIIRDGKAAIVIPRMRTWAIAVFETSGGPDPLFALTTPVEDAASVLTERAAAHEKEVADKKEKAGIGPGGKTDEPKLPPYMDYSRAQNSDIDAEKDVQKPPVLEIARDGRLDLHHARGPFSWLNPMEAVWAMLNGGRFAPSWVDLVGFKLGPNGCMDEFPGSYESLLQYDVLVLDNIHASYLGAKRRVMIADFVRAGGGVLIFGGYCNLSLGADHNTYLEDLMPVRIAGFKQILQDNNGLPLKIEKPERLPGIAWTSAPQAFTVDVSPLKDGAEVWMTAGGKPALVAGRYGKGRVLVFMINPHGDYGAQARPYWKSAAWPRILAACVQWLGEGSEAKSEPAFLRKKGDPSRIKPEDLAVEAFDLESAEFTAKLKEARVNVVNGDSARAMLETIAENADKVEDMELLSSIIEETRVFFDKSMAPLGEKLIKSDHEFIRQAGFQILGMAGDPKYRLALEQALADRSEAISREALIGLGRLGDAASLPAVKRYMQTGGEKLLAHAVLIRLGDKSSLGDAMAAYEQGVLRRLRLKCGRGAIIDTLWGGVSFKLTPQQRKQAMNEYRKVLRLEEQARFDVAYFMESLRNLNEDDIGAVIAYLKGTERREVISLAPVVLARMKPERASAYRRELAGAKLEELRWLAAEE